MAEKLNPIPVEFVVDFAREFPTAKLREPYVQLINRWALHEKQATEGLEISGQLKDASQKKNSKMPRSLQKVLKKIIVGQVHRMSHTILTTTKFLHVENVSESSFGI